MTDAAVGRLEDPSSTEAGAPPAVGEAGVPPVVTGDAGQDAPEAPDGLLPDPEPTPVAAAGTGPDAVAQPVAEFSVVLVAGISVDLPNQYPTVVLREAESPRRQLSFSIGLQDGIVLSHAVRRIATPRPLTPELMSGVLQRFDIDVVAVRIVGRQGAVYFAELDLRGRSSRSVLSCRPSDALTLAVLQPVPAPILVDQRLFEQSGDVLPG